MLTEPRVADDTALRNLSSELGKALLDARLRLAVAESCTGGWIAKALTDVPGSSDWFEAGFVTYSNAAKQRLLGVSELVLDAHGAVSESVVREMADGARRVTGSGAAIAVSGIAGPDGGNAEKPVGLVWVGWSLDANAWASEFRFSGDREAVRRQAVEAALTGLIDGLREFGHLAEK